MKRDYTGHHIAISTVGETCRAFIPVSLPPEPPLNLSESLNELLYRATLALGRLDGITLLLPEPSLFLYMYVRKEAVLSSQIEGTQSSLSDLLLHENKESPGVPTSDVQEVSNYAAALKHGLKRLHDNFPLSLRLIKELHAVLLAKGRGSGKMPGEFRRSQNWIGGTRPGNAAYVPPPPEHVTQCMGTLEKFIHNDPVKTPTLIKAALVHVQFETIHPFLDGNGRLGRLLIALILCAEGALAEPMLYLSLYFKQNRTRYYELLQNVRMEGDWESWLDFFLSGIKETADGAVRTIRRLLKLFDNDIQKIHLMGRVSGSAIRVHQYMQRHPLCSIAKMTKDLHLTVPTVASSLNHLEKAGIVKELTGHKRNRLFAYKQYIKILSEGTEPIPSESPSVE